MKLRALVAAPWRWDALAAGLFTLVSLAMYAGCLLSHAPGSDGFYSWMYARSLAYDHDVDFSNDYALCGDPFKVGWITPTGRPANFFYMGPAVFWTPVIFVLKFLVHSGDARVDGGCVGPIPAITLALGCFAGGGVVLATSAVLRRVVGPRLAAVTALLAALGGHVIYFSSTSVSYSHVYDALCVTVFAWCLLRAREQPGVRWVLLAALALGLAVLQRSSNGVFGLLAVGALSRRGDLQRSARDIALVAAGSFLTGLLPLMLALRAIYGRWMVYAHGPHFLHLAHSHPFLLLFDQRGGVFASAPVLWVGVMGLVPLLRRRELAWLTWPLAACGAFELWSSASALDYQGGRRLLNLTLLGALAMAAALDPCVRWLLAKRGRLEAAAALGVVTVVGLPNVLVALGFATEKLPWDKPLTTAERYGEAERALMAQSESVVGPLTVLPAAWTFSLRYHVAPATYGIATTPSWFSRDMHTLEYQEGGFVFGADAKPLLVGMELDGERACLHGDRGSFVFSAQWPFATRARVYFDATGAGKLSLASRSFLGVRQSWGELAVEPGHQRKHFFSIPPGAFDSGLNEVVVEHDPADGVCLRAVDFLDDAVYPAAPEAEASPPVSLWHAEQYASEGASPCIAVGSVAGQVFDLETHETTAGHVAYAVGRYGEVRDPQPFDAPGRRPRVVTGAGDGWVLEVESELAEGGLAYRTGHVSMVAGGPHVVWSARQHYGVGRHAAIATWGDRVVEVHESPRRPPELVVRMGQRREDDVIWGAEVSLGPGYEPAIAIDHTSVAVVAQSEARSAPLAVYAGFLEGDHLVFAAPTSHVRGTAPAVTSYRGMLIELHQEDDNLVVDTSPSFGGGAWQPSWTTRQKYDHGARPMLGVDAVTGRAAEVHEGNRDLWMHDADVIATLRPK